MTSPSALLSAQPINVGNWKSHRRDTTDPLHGIVYPRLIEASGRCPPEDVGGPWGYDEFLRAIEDKTHARHSELREWIGENYDPLQVNGDRLAANVEKLARKWSRKPTSRKPRVT